MVAMSELRDLFKRLGFAGAQSLLQSGNLVFQSDQPADASLENLLSVETEKHLNVSIEYFVRSREEWETVVAVNPFPKEAKRDPGRLVVMFLKDAPKPTDVKALQSAIQGPETARCHGKQLYVHYPAGMGKSKLTHALIEKKLGTRGTGRNWNTVLKLAALTRR
jgi:uncharacterized protein (DUF1697 family)